MEYSRWLYTTTGKCKINFILPEFHSDRMITWDAHVHTSDVSKRYDMILGRDLLNALQMDIRFSDSTITWQEGTIPMKPIDCDKNDSFYIKDDVEEDLGKILDAKYEKAHLDKVVASYNHLSAGEQTKLLQLLQSYASLFDGTLGTWKGNAYDIELKADAAPYHARAYNIPKSVEKPQKSKSIVCVESAY